MPFTKSGHAKPANNMRRQPCTNSTLGVFDIVRQLHLGAVFERKLGINNHLRIKRIRHFGAGTATAADQFIFAVSTHQNGVKIKVIKRSITAAYLRQQIGTTNHLLQCGKAKTC